MSKRTQKESGEERVTAKSKPMMNLVSRCTVRDLNVLASIASESPVKTRYESQIPLSSWTEQQPRTGRLVKDACSSSYSEWDTGEKRSSQNWKADELMDDRRGHPLSLLGQGHTSSNQVSLMRRPSTLFWKKKKLMDTRCLPSKRSKATSIHHWRRRNRIGIVVRIQIILE